MEAENRDEGLQGSDFHPKKQEMVEGEGGASVQAAAIGKQRNER